MNRCSAFLFFYSVLQLEPLHSFPTRRSSDLLRQFFRAPLHSLVKLRYQLAAFGRENLQVRAENTHGLQLLFRKRSEEHTSELQSPYDLVCRLLLEKKNMNIINNNYHTL